MQEQFTYRELSEKLDINIAKLKRWGREFLPPDYSAGQGQGVARILTIDEAFILELGGWLVSRLNYSTHHARIILKDIKPILIEKKLLPSLIDHLLVEKVKDWEVIIRYNSIKDVFWYRFKGMIKSTTSKWHRWKGPIIREKQLIHDEYMLEYFYVDMTDIEVEKDNEKKFPVYRLLEFFFFRLGEREIHNRLIIKTIQ